MTHNPNNERVKRQYLTFLKEAKQHSEATVDAVAKALSRFEEDTGWRDFRSFRSEQAVAFKQRLARRDGRLAGQKLSKATLYATLAQLKCFFQWLAQRPGYKSRLSYSDAEYFNLSDKETRIATARRESKVPTLDEIRHVIARMPSSSDLEQRDRALVAFILLTGARDRAVASLKLKHVDLLAECVYHDAREVLTKNSKTFVTYFFPVGSDVQAIVADWVEFLRVGRLWGNDDPLFPSTDVRPDASRRFAAAGLSRSHWTTSAPIRAIFRDAFGKAGLPYFNPHSFRSTIAQLGEAVCQTPEQFKAWSQNLGHEQVLTTFRSYGHVAPRRQREIIRDLGKPASPHTALDESAVARELANIHAKLNELGGSQSRGLPIAS